MVPDLKRVHIEASGRCNSKCPMCSRFTTDGHLQPGLNTMDLEDEMFFKFFTEERTKNLDHVYFSGVYGDPCLNKSLVDYVKWFKKHKVDVAIDTNAGYRSTKWWAELGAMNTRVHFALDGLADTNHLYRRGVVWDKVWRNVNAFQEAGGNGAWTFIVFRHNEHQVEEAKELAASLGMDFRLKVTQKFRGHKNWAVMEDGKRLYDLEPPKTPEYRHPNVGDVHHLPGAAQFKFNLDKSSPFDDVEIECQIQDWKELFLAHTGHLMPCCFLGTLHHDSPGAYQFNQEFDMSRVDLHKVTPEQAIENLYDIERRFKLKSIAEGKLLTCARTCGKQFQNKTVYVNDSSKK